MAESIQDNPSPSIIEIVPDEGSWFPDFSELWDYRELLFFLAWRDIKIRYKQTVMGALWAIIQPLVSMIIFTLFFNRLAGIEADGDTPYEIFSYAALVPWTYFATSLSTSAISLVNNSNLIKKVYFPRLLVPVASVFAGLVDFVIAFITLIFMMLAFGIVPTANVIWLPFFVLQIIITALGIGFWFSAMNVQFRDVKYVIPFATQLWMFITPIVYPSSLIENDTLRAIYGLNPMAGVIEGFRWALIGEEAAPAPDVMVAMSFVVSLILLVTGLIYFKRMEKTFADVI